MSNYIRIVRGFSPSVQAYILANAAIGFAYFGIAMVIFNLFLLRLGYGLALIGQVNGVGQLCWALMAIPASLIGRRFGLRRIMVGGSLLITFGYILFLLISRLPTDIRVTWLFATTILIWVGAALITVNGLPFISSVTRMEERSHALAVTNAASSLTAILGSLTAGFMPGWVASLTHTSLAEAYPYQLTFWFTPLFFALAAYFYGRMIPSEQEESAKENRQAAPVPMWIFLFFGVVIFLQTASEGGLRAFFNVYLDADLGVSIAQIGTLFGIAGLLPILGALVMPLLVARLGSVKSFAVVALAMAAALVLVGAFPYPLAAALGFILFNMLGSLIGSIRGVLSQEIVAPRWRGATSAILILGLALGWASMALLGGAIIGVVDFRGLMYISALSGIFSVILVIGYLRLRSARSLAPALVQNIEG